MRVAVIHDWLVVYAGAERVLERILCCYPDADLFAVVDFLPPEKRGFIMNKPVQTSFVQNLPLVQRNYRLYFPLMPLAVEQFDLSGYDLVISSSHAVAKGVITGPDQLHVSYVHSPMRYAWDLQHQYLKESGLMSGPRGWLAKLMLHKMRLWDLRTANGVDSFLANSFFISRRVWKIYRRKAKVIFPPVDVAQFSLCEKKENFYLAASRLVPYKRMDLIVEAFSAMPSRQLVVIGDGPEMRRLKANAGPNVTILGYQADIVLRDAMQRARAFVFAAEEDFGIMPLEAQACGTPVIAYGKGGVLETIRGLDAHTPTGVFFPEQSVASLCAAVERFESSVAQISPRACRENALRFSVERFDAELKQFMEAAWKDFCYARALGAGRGDEDFS